MQLRFVKFICIAFVVSGSSAALAQDGHFFSNDFFIEEDVMVEGAFDSGYVTETYDETVEAGEDAESDEAENTTSDDDGDDN